MAEIEIYEVFGFYKAGLDCIDDSKIADVLNDRIRPSIIDGEGYKRCRKGCLTVCNEASKISSDYTVPCCACSRVKL